jgi:hypothetical protein
VSPGRAPPQTSTPPGPSGTFQAAPAAGEAALELDLQLGDVDELGKLQRYPLGRALEADGETEARAAAGSEPSHPSFTQGEGHVQHTAPSWPPLRLGHPRGGGASPGRSSSTSPRPGRKGASCQTAGCRDSAPNSPWRDQEGEVRSWVTPAMPRARSLCTTEPAPS